jgi:hypothetical protein
MSDPRSADDRPLDEDELNTLRTEEESRSSGSHPARRSSSVLGHNTCNWGFTFLCDDRSGNTCNTGWTFRCDTETCTYGWTFKCDKPIIH